MVFDKGTWDSENIGCGMSTAGECMVPNPHVFKGTQPFAELRWERIHTLYRHPPVAELLSLAWDFWW